MHGLHGDRRGTWSGARPKAGSKRKTPGDESPKLDDVKRKRDFLWRTVSRLPSPWNPRSRSPMALESGESSPVASSAPNADPSATPSPDTSPAPSATPTSNTVQDREVAPTKTLLWPSELLPDAIPGSRISTWGYDVDIVRPFSSASTTNLSSHANTFLADLCGFRRSPEERSRPLVFMAHSLGGIVVKYVWQTFPY